MKFGASARGRVKPAPMKTLLHCLTLALFLATASPAWAVEKFLKATVTGTVQTQVTFSASEARFRTALLNNKRIFQEFGVSKDDYVLVVNVSNGGELLLLPKSSSSGLPTISVAKVGSSKSIIDTKVGQGKVQAVLAPSAATNLFKDLVGDLTGTIFFQGPVVSLSIKKFVFTIAASGTDTNPVSTGVALLKFKTTAQGVFLQQP